MKTMSWVTAEKKAKAGEFEFINDMKVGMNEVRTRKFVRDFGHGRVVSAMIYITSDNRKGN